MKKIIAEIDRNRSEVKAQTETVVCLEKVFPSVKQEPASKKRIKLVVSLLKGIS